MSIDWAQVEAIIRDDQSENKAGPGAGGECPAPEDLVRLVERKAGRKARARAMEHVAHCPECARVLQSLLRLSSEVDRITGMPQAVPACPPDLVRDERSVKRRRWTGRRLAWATLVSLAGLAVVTVTVIKLSERPVVRGSAGPAIRLISPKMSASLALRDVSFRWEAVPEASSYFVEIFGRSLDKIWRSEPLSKPQAVLPAEVREGLQRGGSYFWRVTAVRDDGREIVSKLAEFSIGK